MADRWLRRLLFGSALFGALLLGPWPFNDAVFAQLPDCEDQPPGEPQFFEKTDNQDPVPAGGVLRYRLSLDPGVNGSADVTINDPIPAQTTFLSLSSPAGFTCSTPAVGSTGSVSCNDPTYTPDGTADDFILRVTVDPAATGTLSNTATLTAVVGQETVACFSAEDTDVGGAVPALTEVARWALLLLLLAAGVFALRLRLSRRAPPGPLPPAVA